MTTDTISHNAMRLWQIMNDGTTWRYNKLRLVSKLSDREIDTALGWLAREDTLEITCDSDTREDVFRIRHFWETGGYWI